MPGLPTEDGLKVDALAAFDAIPETIREPGGIIVQGFSLGTGLALHVAARRKVNGVILSAPFSKLCSLMTRASLLPACWLPGVDTWKSALDAREVDTPVLVVHGLADSLIPVAEGRRLFQEISENAGGSNLMVELEEIGHNNMIDAPAYLAAITEFIGSL